MSTGEARINRVLSKKELRDYKFVLTSSLCRYPHSSNTFAQQHFNFLDYHILASTQTLLDFSPTWLGWFIFQNTLYRIDPRINATALKTIRAIAQASYQ